jgi:virginiamycin B lyase
MENRSSSPRAAPYAMLLLVAALVGGLCRAETIPGFAAQPLATPAGAFPGAQTRDPIGEVYYSDFGGKIGRISADGSVAESAVPSSGGSAWQPSGLAFGPDGALWFLVTDSDAAETRIARWRLPGPDFWTFPLPTPGGGGGPLIVGPDGKLWYAQPAAAKLGRVDLTGSVEEQSLGAQSSPTDLACAADGNVWVALENGAALMRVAPDGTAAEFSLPAVAGTEPRPARIVAAGGGLVVTDPATNSLWSVTTAGAATRISIPAPSSEPYGLAASPGGISVYFTERTADAIGRLDLASGMIAESAMPAAATRQFPHEITLAFPFPEPRPTDTFVVNSPLLFFAQAPATPAPRGPSLRLRLSVDDGQGGSPGPVPAPGVPFRCIAEVENTGDSPSSLDLLVSIVLPANVELVSAGDCVPSGGGVLLCPAQEAIAAGARKSFAATLNLRDGAVPAVPLRALSFNGGDPVNPKSATFAFGHPARSEAPLPVVPVTPVGGRSR